MNLGNCGDAVHRPSAFNGLSLIIGIAFVLLPSTAGAHEFGVGKGAYEDFLSGNQAVLADVPVLLGILAAGLLAGIWKPDGFPLLWPFYAIGLLLGVATGFSGVLPPAMPMYVTVLAIGLLGAAAPQLSVNIMRGLYVVIGTISANAVLSGHTVSEIPLFAYLGIAFAFNIGVAACAGLVLFSHRQLPHDWVAIFWRAGMSWIVAVTVMAMALMLRNAG